MLVCTVARDGSVVKLNININYILNSLQLHVEQFIILYLLLFIFCSIHFNHCNNENIIHYGITECSTIFFHVCIYIINSQFVSSAGILCEFHKCDVHTYPCVYLFLYILCRYIYMSLSTCCPREILAIAVIHEPIKICC